MLRKKERKKERKKWKVKKVEKNELRTYFLECNTV
jgi:hypothetical protein